MRVVQDLIRCQVQLVHAVGPVGGGDHLDQDLGLFLAVGFDGFQVLGDGECGHQSQDQDRDQDFKEGKGAGAASFGEKIHTISISGGIGIFKRAHQIT